MLSFFALIVAMFITMMLIPPLMRSAERFSFVDIPDARKVHSAPVPRIGGLAMVAGAVTPILLWMDLSQEVQGFLYGVGLILFFGVWDDRATLDYRIKFFGHTTSEANDPLVQFDMDTFTILCWTDGHIGVNLP